MSDVRGLKRRPDVGVPQSLGVPRGNPRASSSPFGLRRACGAAPTNGTRKLGVQLRWRRTAYKVAMLARAWPAFFECGDRNHRFGRGDGT